MGHAASHLPMSSAQYLAWDEYQAIKHEFLHGELYATTGVRDRHATTVLNLAFALRQHLRGTPCRVDATDVKLRVEAANAYFYPDLRVTCGQADRSSPRITSLPADVVFADLEEDAPVAVLDRQSLS